MKFEDTSGYIEGQWASKGVSQYVERTTYGTIEQAIATKKEVVRLFEDKFGFSREMEEPDSKYAWECGFLDGLLEVYNKKEE